MRLEEAEARVAADFAEVAGGVWQAIGGGVAAFAGADSPLTHAVGVGMGGPVSREQFDRLEDFFRSRGAVPHIHLCPLADPSLNEHFGRHGYRIAEFNHVLTRPLDPSERYPNDTVQIATDEFIWAKTVSMGFFDREDFTIDELELGALLFRLPAGIPWLATVEGEPAAAAGMAIQGRLASLFGASTVPRFRRRGLQTALIQARVGHAASRGCDLATTSVTPGSVSHYNLTRLWFRIAYTKLIMTKDA